MKLQDWLPIILMVGVFLAYLPFRRVYERLPDWLVYALCLAAGGLTVLTAILARATEYLAFVVAFFVLAFVHLVHTRRQQRQAGSAS
ncbi:hypothetical protein [Rhodothermus marinus]|jgi:hypothetical protein|uniref:hypothetical protein n=1 Tax=Rhodothermus marinus TaxID=29549 RepID=UPI0012BA4027|nr:hypothetical protein [Rhodothermus marinus]BBM68597.1 hypothetical protein RmaAA213_04430 [Rhodothermus marinus]